MNNITLVRSTATIVYNISFIWKQHCKVSPCNYNILHQKFLQCISHIEQYSTFCICKFFYFDDDLKKIQHLYLYNFDAHKNCMIHHMLHNSSLPPSFVIRGLTQS